MKQIVTQNKSEINEDFIEIILKEIITYRHLGNFRFASDLTEIALLCTTILGNEHYIVSSQISKAELISWKNNFNIAFELCNNIRKDHILDEKSKAKLFLIEGNLYSKIKDHKKALLLYKSSKKIYNHILDDVQSTIVKINIARIYLDRNKLIEAEKLFIECEKFFQAKGIKYTLGLAQAIEGRGKVEADRHNYQKSFDFLEKAFDLYNQARLPLQAFYVKSNLLLFYTKINAFKEAHDACKNTREIFSQFDVSLELGRVDWYGGLVYQKEGKSDKALQLIQKTKKIFKKFNVETDLARILLEEAVIHLQRKNYDKSMDLFIESR